VMRPLDSTTIFQIRIRQRRSGAVCLKDRCCAAVLWMGFVPTATCLYVERDHDNSTSFRGSPSTHVSPFVNRQSSLKSRKRLRTKKATAPTVVPSALNFPAADSFVYKPGDASLVFKSRSVLNTL